jgi:heat shock protein HslJ
MSRHLSRPVSRPASRSIGATVLGLVLVLTLLPSAAVAQAEDDATDPRNFERQWQLLEYRDTSGDLQLVPPGIGITLLPYRKRMKGEAACSSFQADYRLIEDSVFVDPPTIEPRGCDAAAQAIDEAFYQGLAETTKWSTRGSILTLRDEVDDVVMTLTRAELPADPTLARWDLARLGAADGAIAPTITGVEPWVEFLRGGRVVGSTGCGSFVGSYTTNDTTMAISDVDARLGDCTEPVRQQAEDILSTFAEVTDFEVLPAGLVLEDAAGTTRMALVPAIDLGARTWTPLQILDADGEVILGEERLNTSAVRFAGGSKGDRGVADGRSFCSVFRGGSVRSGLALSAFDLEPTGGACPAPIKGEAISPQDTEDAFLDGLQRTASHALRGDELELMDVDGLPVMRLEPQAELVGPTWVVEALDISPQGRKQKFKEPVLGARLTAVFEDIEAGFVQGETGKNDYFATYETPGASQIRISGADPIVPSCKRQATKPLCKQETLFLQLLESADTFIVRSEDLRLFVGTRPILRFVPEQLLASTPAATEEPTPEP